jgi:hypothetical protein
MGDIKRVPKLLPVYNRIFGSFPEMLQVSRKKNSLDFKAGRPQTSAAAQKPEIKGELSETSSDLNCTVMELRAMLDKERQETAKIKEDCEQRLERSIRREHEYRKIIAEFERHLLMRGADTSSVFGGQASIYLNKIHALQEKVIGNIGSFQHKTSVIMQTQGEDLVKEFTTKLMLKDRELEEEKKKILDDVGSLAENEAQLMRKMATLRGSIEFIDSKNKKLAAENQTLKVQLKAQDNDREILLRQVVLVKREAAAAKEELEKCRAKLASETEDKGNSFSADMDSSTLKWHSKGKSSFNDDGRSEVVINRLKKLVEIERKKLRAAQTALAKELESRTELEKLFRRCVEDVRQEIHHRRSETRLRCKVTDTTLADREKLIEALLSHERALVLMYDKSFPPRAVSRDCSRSGDKSELINH